MGCGSSNPKIKGEPLFLGDEIEYFSLLLANTDYTHQKGYANLKAPKKNLEELQDLLEVSNFQNPIVLCNPERDEIIEHFSSLATISEGRAKRRKKSVFFFYVSGHGIVDS